MELLILGLLLVALMVYVSTRIKKNAARAFEEEMVETDRFSLSKPEGFLHIINGDPAYAFQGYSKEFGTGDGNGQRQATVDLLITNKKFPDVCSAAKELGSLITDKHFQFDEMKAASFEMERSESEVEFIDHYFIVDAPGGVFQLRARVLKENNNELSPKIGKMEESLSIKR